MLVGIWTFARLTRTGLVVTEIPGMTKSTAGLIASAVAVAVFGMGVAVASLDSAVLVPFGLLLILIGAWIGIYGVRLFRTRSDAATSIQFRQLTSRALMLGQAIALVGLIPVLGVYFYLTDQRVVGLLLIGVPLALAGVLLERAMDSLLTRPLLPRAWYRFITVGGIVAAVTAVVVLVVH